MLDNNAMNLQDSNIFDLDINPDTITALKKADLTNKKTLLSLSVPDIERLTGLSTNHVLSLKSIIASRFVPKQKCKAIDIFRCTAHKSLLHWKLSTECPVIDSALRGGLVSGLLTEVAGESACGKTQLCLQICISAELHRKGAVYISTEDVFPSKRLQQMIQHHSCLLNRKGLGNGIFIEHVSDFDTLDFCVTKKLPTLLNRGDISLVVIDSVAALFRCHYDSTQTVERAEHLIRFASFLRTLASDYNIPVVCVNQVTANMQGSAMFGIRSLTPSLGLTWANQIHCRIMMCRPNFLSFDAHNFREWLSKKNPQSEPTLRQLNIFFAPHIPRSEIAVYIDNTGIHGIDSH